MSAIERLWRKVRGNSNDFNSWISLLDAVEKQSDTDESRKAFDAFFDRFPYCYGYWKKYADLERHAGNKDRCLEIYERGVKAIPLSIDLWTAYLDATLEFFHGQIDYEIRMRNLYERALEVAGMEFRSDALWEHYISWESGHNNFKRVLAIYDRLLRLPTQLYFQNWDSFKKLIEENKPEEVLPKDEFCVLLARVSPVAGTALRIALKTAAESGDDSETAIAPALKKAAAELTETDRATIRQFVIDDREKIYQATYLQIMKRWYFEEKIRRPYFHVKPLEEVQLANWAEYLSFEEAEAALAASSITENSRDTDTSVVDVNNVKLARKRVRVLYERCLAACALYENMWIRYAKYLEYTENDIPAARNVWRRACNVHLRTKPTIHWHWALFEERHPAMLDVLTNAEAKSVPPVTCLEILTDLEQRLPDSALTCARRADAMRRANEPLLSIIVCIRSGINRLRLRASEQANLAHSASGPTGSMTAALALATSAQARAGAGYLALKLARLLHRNAHGLVADDGLPIWQLLLSAAYKVEPEEPEPPMPTLNMKQENVDEQVAAKDSEVILLDSDSDSREGKPAEVMDADDGTLQTHGGIEVEQEGVQEEEEEAVTPETISKNIRAEDDIEMETADSPPIVLVRTKTSSQSVSADVGEIKAPKEENGAQKTEDGVPDAEKLVSATEGEVKKKKKRKSRWGSQPDLLAAREEEEQRLAAADADAKLYAEERREIICVRPPSPSSLADEDMRILSPEEAAIAVIKEAIEYDPRNERLFSQLLDIAYQRHPIDILGFLEFADFAIVDSLLPATVKLAFCQRKLQFLEEFGQDLRQVSTAYDEYLSLAQLVCRCTTNRQAGVDAERAYVTPDLLNVVLPAPLRPSARHNLATNAPVRRMPRLTTTMLDDAASVGTPIPPAETALGHFTAGAYEPLAAAQGITAGLPPPAPTMVPIAAPIGIGTNGVAAGDTVASSTTELWSGGGATGYYFAPANSAEVMGAVGLDFNVPAPPPAPPLSLASGGTSTVN